MSAPTRRINSGRGHSYTLDGRVVPGVTTIIGNGLPKPALINWAANTTADYAVDHWDELASEPPSKRLAVLKQARYVDRDAAANRGTQVHSLAEQLVHGVEVDVPDALAGHVESYVRFLDEWAVEPVIVERPVFNRTWRYGGTFDLIAESAHWDGTALLDIKTSRSGPFGSTSLQLAGYRFAEIYLDERGAEHPMPHIDWCGVIWVRADGYDLLPFEANQREFQDFLYCAMVARFADRERDLRGEALTPPRRTEAAS